MWERASRALMYPTNLEVDAVEMARTTMTISVTSSLQNGAAAQFSFQIPWLMFSANWKKATVKQYCCFVNVYVIFSCNHFSFDCHNRFVMSQKSGHRKGPRESACAQLISRVLVHYFFASSAFRKEFSLFGRKSFFSCFVLAPGFWPVNSLLCKRNR